MFIGIVNNHVYLACKNIGFLRIYVLHICGELCQVLSILKFKHAHVCLHPFVLFSCSTAVKGR